ncbi:Cgl0159 family (beta/alpha)8-fold protein [Nonomuraea cavernae]|uniref:Aldolase n=1 Tax=Nonomuraea cavernae TaxID=2045107 RepID=A0A917Z1R0_9ACTN|nr:deoxyribose-phosphate aldolase [Nonomuraea cavernae]MCA2190496.1 deoxyribose-phosphate aldolase [Nonomuraea cavernae]GGO70553.1 aldolase [Nonomuraea cavernae]
MSDITLPRTSPYERLTDIRATRPEEIALAAARRPRRGLPGAGERLLIIAADHPARAALGVRDRPLAMASRTDLLDRLRLALSRPGVDGILASPDVMEDLLLLGALDGKLAFGSMNRGGLMGSVFELDDRFTGFDAASIDAMGLDGGKMLCRIDPGDPATVATLESCAHAVTSLARRRLTAMVEPFWSLRSDTGVLRNDLSPEAVIKSISVAQALGVTSAYTWLKIPAVAEMERVMAATTLPALLLGGDPPDIDAAYADWGRALRLPGVRGLVVGRALLYPADDDVAAVVDGAAALVREARS